MEGIEKIKEAFEVVAKRLREVVRTFSKLLHRLFDKIYRESKDSKKKNGGKDPFRCRKMSKNKLKKYNYIPVNQKKRPNQRRNI